MRVAARAFFAARPRVLEATVHSGWWRGKRIACQLALLPQQGRQDQEFYG